MAVSVYGPADKEATPAGTVPARVFQVDQMMCGSLDGVSVEDADRWLAERIQAGTVRGYYGTKGWIDPASERNRCPWAATWYREQDGVLRFYAANWDSSD